MGRDDRIPADPLKNRHKRFAKNGSSQGQILAFDCLMCAEFTRQRSGCTAFPLHAGIPGDQRERDAGHGIQTIVLYVL